MLTDKFVAIKRVEGKRKTRKSKEIIVGHVPLTLSRIFHLFLNHGGGGFLLQLLANVETKALDLKSLQHTLSNTRRLPRY